MMKVYPEMSCCYSNSLFNLQGWKLDEQKRKFYYYMWRKEIMQFCFASSIDGNWLQSELVKVFAQVEHGNLC